MFEPHFKSRGIVLGQDTSEPQPSTGETMELHKYVTYRRDITEIVMKAAKHNSINQLKQRLSSSL